MNKALLFLALSAIASCSDGILFNPNYFLGDNGEPIVTEKCQEETSFTVDKIKITPDTITKGEEITIKVQGTALVDLSLKNFHIVTNYNGTTIYTTDKAVEKTLAPGESYIFDYSAAVPGFIPSGDWEIYVTLVTTTGDSVACIKASFTMP